MRKLTLIGIFFLSAFLSILVLAGIGNYNADALDSKELLESGPVVSHVVCEDPSGFELVVVYPQAPLGLQNTQGSVVIERNINGVVTTVEVTLGWMEYAGPVAKWGASIDDFFTNNGTYTIVSGYVANDPVNAQIQNLPYTVELACSELAVMFLDFSASVSGRDVTLSWTTSWENNNLGFNVYRQNLTLADVVNPMQQINKTMIPGNPGGLGATYTWTDAYRVYGQSYRYWVGGIDFNGEITMSDPVTVYVPSPFSKR